MNKLARNAQSGSAAEPKQSGPNLILIYALLALMLVAAMAFAALIVWPFHGRH
jgi:hypothetical protein